MRSSAALLVTLTVALTVALTTCQSYRPCSEISRDLRLPCTCSLGPVEAALDDNPAIFLNCDEVVFSGDLPSLPFGAPVVAFSQKRAGHQSLPTQIFAAASGLPLRSIDLSQNSLRRLTERLLQGLQTSLVELRLADNLLGDTLNPIFSTSELHNLNNLQLLDLSGNVIKAIEEGILEGCDRLQALYLDRNSLTSIPSSSLNGPKSLKILSLKENRITAIKTSAFLAQPDLETVDLSGNLIQSVEALDHLPKLRILNLAFNRLSRFNSDVFDGVPNLQRLDLSQNFIGDVPKVALKGFKNLRYLNLSSNLIRTLDQDDLAALGTLYHLDLSRNNIGNIAPGTFLGLKQLRLLDLSVNSLRTIEDDAFEGLDNLEHLNLKDNNILLIPASALGRLPKLTTLHLDYNRVAAISADILRSIADKITFLALAKNVIRELPPDSFQQFQKLRVLDLTRNLLNNLNSDSFNGLESTLKVLHLKQNRITQFAPLTLPKLEYLDLSENLLAELQIGSLPSLQTLNLSRNSHLVAIPSNLLHKLPQLEVFDLSYTGLKILSKDFFIKSSNLRTVNLAYNSLNEMIDGSFTNLPNLTHIDLSHNNINNIKSSAFINVMSLRTLKLDHNQLTSFKGEFFNTGTSLELLDISHNELSYLFPSSFKIHPRLRQINASNNKFTFFPAELISNLQFLQTVDLSNNKLRSVEELDFARLPHLRTLLLHHNLLESISEMSFHNSTQLQVIDLSYNRLERIGERTFEGLLRLELLNLENNSLSDLPETIFDRSRLQMLENINLARNQFEIAPLKALARQYFFINSVDLSYNKLKDIPADDSIMVNIKKLDLSFNNLTEDTVQNVLGEPKTIRELNLAGNRITQLASMETPFLTVLNVSNNAITQLTAKTFERTTLLEVLDLSNNKISDISNFYTIWNVLKSLQSLNISNNPIESVSQTSFDGLDALRSLSMTDLVHCERIEKNAFKSLGNLAELQAYNYPKLGYIDLSGLLPYIPSVERLSVETKDSAIGSDQLHSVLTPRLKELGLMGSRLRSVSSGTLSGLKNEEVLIKLVNTSLNSLPPALFFPVPRSSKLTLDVSGSQLTTLSPQILVTLEDRRGDLVLQGLETNPITCDCNARALRRSLPAHMLSLRCQTPDYLAGRLLVEVGDDELTCDVRKHSTLPSVAMTTASTSRLSTRYHRFRTTEPEIIWSVASTEKAKTKPPMTAQTTIGNDDTLIIGIVGGVVAFIAILIIIICIIRLRMTTNQYRGGPLAAAVPPTAPSSCACSVKGPQMYAMPQYAAGYAATLPHKNAVGTLRPANYSTMGRVPYAAQPYFIAYADDSKSYR